ncbi:GNAT family N-acetyltransferase [Cupriavidus sp. CV2]|uniref:GNAT family N-acetyltransferase n=1 Tax=Cupriavidus ulmosensis TaxID=3065913 RepID=UPI00296B3358|nr:GNAT family N-acetyltransferase [Cupriavidus sp. CV2]MDW3686737.1 GNAT family N-acetyltransferase [Cupriavidus sp. CV2]
MLTHVYLRPASQADTGNIAALLTQCGLATENLEEILDSFQIALCDDRLVGCAAAECHGQSIVIRSVAVEPAYRDRGIASRLVEKLLVRARGTEARHAFLLSTSAPAYFARWGFSRIPVNEAPPELQASPEFRNAARSSALCMHCELR